MQRLWQSKQSSKTSTFNNIQGITMIYRWRIKTLLNQTRSKIQMKFKERLTKNCLRKKEQLPKNEYLSSRITGQGQLMLSNIMNMSSRSPKIQKKNKSKLILNTSKQKRKNKIEIRISITSSTRILIERWKKG